MPPANVKLEYQEKQHGVVMPLMPSSLHDPSPHRSSFPRERACSLIKPQRNHQPIFLFFLLFFFKADILHFTAIKSLGSFSPVPCSLQACQALGSQQCSRGVAAPSAGHSTPQALLGRGLRQGKDKVCGLPCSRHFHQS